MITEDQTPVIDFLAAPSTHGGATVERIDTHASSVFLAGARAYKLKRAVRFDYLDFSTPERRRTLCEAEVRLNQRTAPALYRGVVAVTRQDDGSFALGGHGRPVDWLVEMHRFPQEALFDRLASAGALGVELMSPLAEAIADFHKSADHRSDHGGKAGMSWVVEGNAAGFAEFGRSCLAPSAASRVTDESRRELDRRAELLERRRQSGFVRQCHGDLHLRNIVLLDGRPTLFDGVEFNDEIACTDVLYDLAFLLMDLWRRKLPQHANTVWNRYLAETADLDGVSLLPLFRPAGQRFAPRRAPRRHNFNKICKAARSSRKWRATISPWPNSSSIRRTRASWRSEASRARGSRPSRSGWPRRLAPSLVRSCCGVTRRGSACVACLSCSASVRRPIRANVGPRLLHRGGTGRTRPPCGPQRRRRCGPCARGRPASDRTGCRGCLGAIHGVVARRARVAADRPDCPAPQRRVRCGRRRRSPAARAGHRRHPLVPPRRIRTGRLRAVSGDRLGARGVRAELLSAPGDSS